MLTSLLDDDGVFFFDKYSNRLDMSSFDAVIEMQQFVCEKPAAPIIVIFCNYRALHDTPCSDDCQDGVNDSLKT